MNQKKAQNNHKYLSEKDINSFKQCKEDLEGIGDRLELTLSSLYNTCRNQDFTIIVPKKDYHDDKTYKTYQKIMANDSALELIHFKSGSYIYGNYGSNNYEISDNFIYRIFKKDEKIASVSLFGNKKSVGGVRDLLKYYSSSIFGDVIETSKPEIMKDTIYEVGYIIHSILTTEEDLKKELNKRKFQMREIITNLDMYLEQTKGVPYMISLYHNDEEGFFRIFSQLKRELREKVIAEVYNQKNKNQKLEDQLCKICPELIEKIGRMKVPDKRKNR